ncbi:FAD-binding oxidoreductase [Dongia deserti]|uniref:FAD-binding oxidoreductase n=1 Tax=Dongia deserti TaxID=2268030 RepID=UPI000E654D95|nr:FAD-binding oxidoreductase [Dongia deserti]
MSFDLLNSLGEMVSTEPAVLEKHACDWSNVNRQRPLAVLRPRSVAEVSAALSLCHEAGLGVVPQGGLTGLAGGATPQAGQVVLSLERLRGIEEIDPDSATIILLAGTPLETAQKAAEEAGLYLALDIGSRGSCQIGGNIATNAGGNHVIRYGMARAQVLGLETVLADGTILTSLTKVMKNNAGYDLNQLFIGSEGTLGIVTRVVLRLYPRPRCKSTALIATSGYDATVRLLRRLQRELGEVSAFEAMWPDFYRYVTDHPAAGTKPMVDTHPFYALTEFQGSDPDRDGARLEECLAAAIEAGDALDALIAQSEREVRSFWTIREGEALDQLPYLINFDVSAPTAQLGGLADQLKAKLSTRWPGGLFFVYGHIGDGNIHLSAWVGETLEQVAHEMDELVYDEVRRIGGSISAEHGIGTLKRAYLDHSRSAAEIDVMRRIKAALDPKGILNPGKVI